MKNLPGIRLWALAALCVLAYAPFLGLPLFEDDYPNIAQALELSSPLAALANPIFRVRATFSWAILVLHGAFQMNPVAYHLASLLVHILNTWLVYWALSSLPAARSAAIWAAGFFAVHEGHQEAVAWFSGLAELFQFLFGGLALLLWIRRRRYLASSLACFALALVSKESAVVFLAFFGLALIGRWKRWPELLPYAALAALAIAAILATRAYSFRFSDGSFSLHAPFWITWPRGMARLLWFWGWIAAAILAFGWRANKHRVTIWAALAWMGIGLLPYSFLTYSTQIPSRQTYLASAGLAALFGLAMAQLWANGPRARQVAGLVAVIALLHNVGYLWYRKRAQFVERAQPTEQLIAAGRRMGGPIRIRCFPLARITAEAALELDADLAPDQILWDGEAPGREARAVFCYGSRR